MPDYRTPSPDEGHEAIRAPLAEAIDNLGEQVARIDDGFLLLLTVSDFAQSTLNTVLAGTAAIGQLQATATDLTAQFADTVGALTARLDDLAARVTALEQPAPPPAPDSDDVPDGDDAPTY